MKLLIRVVVLIFIFIAAINYLDYNRIIEKETEGSIVTERKRSLSMMNTTPYGLKTRTQAVKFIYK
ncbi:hypothetical protein FZC84_10685 [Rossellomorea vietnamensis]|uniref:Uncharacterized protein n=1 Tax=Rossellomorea vietnamensis TaxID=218284 RepID=A0A5D4MC72_9BACI|nr:hypothetical protein [Rossellomorea vietnamensis]TYR99221.1 hypothetical protein FZC84_10685 [Rossellomorea vietnamensis]